MPDDEQVWIEVTERGYVRDGVQYSEGAILRVPESALPNVEGVDPPRGRRVSREYAEAVRGGESTEGIDPEPTGEPSYQPEVNASAEARDLAETYRIDLTAVDGTGESGRVLKADVVDVLESRA